ncbi:MAG: hypothetical protein MJ124_03500 [Lachnospiraceae bacterium]|nr:hypothetical protein [Lachnospiraceae bacterium]
MSDLLACPECGKKVKIIGTLRKSVECAFCSHKYPFDEYCKAKAHKAIMDNEAIGTGTIVENVVFVYEGIFRGFSPYQGRDIHKKFEEKIALIDGINGFLASENMKIDYHIDYNSSKDKENKEFLERGLVRGYDGTPIKKKLVKGISREEIYYKFWTNFSGLKEIKINYPKIDSRISIDLVYPENKTQEFFDNAYECYSKLLLEHCDLINELARKITDTAFVSEINNTGVTYGTLSNAIDFSAFGMRNLENDFQLLGMAYAVIKRYIDRNGDSAYAFELSIVPAKHSWSDVSYVKIKTIKPQTILESW